MSFYKWTTRTPIYLLIVSSICRTRKVGNFQMLFPSRLGPKFAFLVLPALAPIWADFPSITLPVNLVKAQLICKLRTVTYQPVSQLNVRRTLFSPFYFIPAPQRTTHQIYSSLSSAIDLGEDGFAQMTLELMSSDIRQKYDLRGVILLLCGELFHPWVYIWYHYGQVNP
jgi:hypothetical protein